VFRTNRSGSLICQLAPREAAENQRAQRRTEEDAPGGRCRFFSFTASDIAAILDAFLCDKVRIMKDRRKLFGTEGLYRAGHDRGCSDHQQHSARGQI
jgi:hypothetical protein